ncbi:hypothetical protein R1sor_012149 [Riccia sorocarpa]|uniref:MADS-box protein n=1 Tax=Riccia sorocarpa TaxID=122646 RepID=A0ABD3I2Y6_9MARC
MEIDHCDSSVQFSGMEIDTEVQKDSRKRRRGCRCMAINMLCDQHASLSPEETPAKVLRPGVSSPILRSLDGPLVRPGEASLAEAGQADKEGGGSEVIDERRRKEGKNALFKIGEMRECYESYHYCHVDVEEMLSMGNSKMDETRTQLMRTLRKERDDLRKWIDVETDELRKRIEAHRLEGRHSQRSGYANLMKRLEKDSNQVYNRQQ